jgi:hydrogenase maturation protein HypF
MDYDKLSIIEKMIDKNINSPLTSSCGRLFDAASSLIGIRDEISYEGQAAMELESFCASGIKERYNFCIYKEGEEFIIDPQEIFIDIIRDLKEGIDKKVMAAKFHNTVVSGIYPEKSSP